MNDREESIKTARGVMVAVAASSVFWVGVFALVVFLVTK